MNILGIDYGEKRIGLAWVDKGLGIVLPFGQAKNVIEVLEIIKKEKIDKLVIGLPLDLDGKENENTKNVRKFADELERSVQLPIDFIDERFSSKQADQMGGIASRDEKAAMTILQSYMDKR